MSVIRSMQVRLPLAVAGVAFVLAGCSSQGSPVSSMTSAPMTSDSGVQFDGTRVSGPVGHEPQLLIGDTTQSTSSIQYKDIVVGTGPVASPTDSSVTVMYVARSAKTKRPFDSSWLRGKPFTYDQAKIGFKGFSEGVPGMRVGGRRVVIIPGPLAYGTNPNPDLNIGPNETQVFVIDLLAVNGQSASASAAISASPSSS